MTRAATAASRSRSPSSAGSWQDANRDPVTSANFPSTSQYTITLGSWIDITLNPTAGATVNAGSFTGGLLTLSGPGVGTAAPLTGPNAVVQIGNPAANEYRVLVTGTFGTGQVNVAFAPGAGPTPPATPASPARGATFSIVAPAQDFFIELSGGLILNAPGVSDPLLSITADIKLVIDPSRGVLTLTFSGQMSVIELGTVGATSGFFVLDTGAGFSNGPQLWGVASMQTNFSKLQAFGLTIFASAYLEINTTGTEHVETISLAGLGPGGGPLVQTYDLQPFTFAIAAAGELKVSIPQTSVTLLDVNGGFFLSLSEDEEVLYATGSTIYGQATGLIIIRTGVEGENAGVAGLLTVGKSEGLDIPGIGSLFTISGSVTIAFNTTSQDQTFTIPQMFVPLLPVGAPTTITVFGAQPGLDGQPAGNPPGRLPPGDGPGADHHRRHPDDERLHPDHRRRLRQRRQRRRRSATRRRRRHDDPVPRGALGRDQLHRHPRRPPRGGGTGGAGARLQPDPRRVSSKVSSCWRSTPSARRSR